MKVTLICQNQELLQQISHPGIDEITTAETLHNELDSQVIIVEQAIVSINELMAYCMAKNHQKIFYLIEEDIDGRMESLFSSKNITLIPADNHVRKISDSVIRSLFPVTSIKNQNVITFLGADHGVGTTMVATSCAEMLAQLTQGRVALFSLSGDPGTTYVKNKDDVKTGIDDIRIKLFNNILTRDELREVMFESRNIHVLRGAQNILNNRHYHPEHAEQLFALAASEYDVIIVDAGANFERGLTIGALSYSAQTYLVATQQQSVKEKFERVEQQILKSLNISTKDFFLIINKYVRENSMLSDQHLADLFKMILAATIPHLEMQGWQAEFDQKSLLHYDIQDYNNSIQHLSRLIASQVKLAIKEKAAKPNLFNKLFGVKRSVRSGT